ncbi:hypothetical protein TNIN_457191 [Trichonephila inaurata madagascariensis]|uniref:Uncharacterized protein n=1 Tax=Trichonephila inaurata madagascariensis TaxID=2747483 RepID=A0A8X6X0J5_9ARAC|nr:hypothetical protein TNIN_457191 [Trichonephila inaurata madagascariensis]
MIQKPKTPFIFTAPQTKPRTDTHRSRLPQQPCLSEISLVIPHPIAEMHAHAHTLLQKQGIPLATPATDSLAFAARHIFNGDTEKRHEKILEFNFRR